MKSRPLAAASLFIFVLAIYLQTFGGVFYSIDEDLYLRITRSLVEEGSFVVAPIEYAPDFGVARGLDGQTYANRGPALPVVAIPFYLLGKVLASLGSPHATPTPNGIEEPTVFTLSLTLANALIVAATVTLLFLTLQRLGYGRWSSVAVALLLAFGTMAWSYASKSFFAEPLLALSTLAAFYCALRHRQGGSRLALLAAGALGGWGILTKVTAFAFIPWLGAYALWPSAGRPLERREALAQLAWLAGGLVPFVLAWMGYNYLRFGGVLTTGYELEGGPNPLVIDDPGLFLLGLYGLLLSSGKGLILYATPLLLALWGAPRFWRSHRAEAVLFFGAGASTIVGIALWRDWSGGWCWGPRLVLDAVPLLITPAVALSGPPAPGRRAYWVIGGLALFSVAVQALGVLPSYLQWYWEVGDYNLVYFSPAHSPILGHWLAVTRGNLDLFWDKTEMFFPGWSPLFAVLRWLLAGIGAAAGWNLWRVLRSARGVPGGSLSETVE